MNWRIYRLPGDREWWRIDHGHSTLVLFVKTIESKVSFKTEEIGGDNAPRAWLAVQGTLYVDGTHAKFFVDSQICKQVTT